MKGTREIINEKLDRFFAHSLIAVPVTVVVLYVGWELVPRVTGVPVLKYLAALIYGLAVSLGFLNFRRGHFYTCGLKKHGFKNLSVILPPLLITVFQLVGKVNTYGAALLDGRMLLFTFTVAAEAGICEELLIRCLPLSNVLCRKDSRGQFIGLAFYTALIFGLIHVENLANGDAMLVLVQICNALGMGVMFAAVYMRTGSILPNILVHFLWDFESLLKPEMANAASDGLAIAVPEGGNMPQNASLFLSGFVAITTVLWIAYGLFLLRKSKWEEIKGNFTKE